MSETEQNMELFFQFSHQMIALFIHIIIVFQRRILYEYILFSSKKTQVRINVFWHHTVCVIIYSVSVSQYRRFDQRVVRQQLCKQSNKQQ
jgi:hypothetical protein